MKSAFRKLSRVGTVTGGMRWYLSEDCLLSAKRMLYAVEYRRFYLRDLESVVVWPSRLWLVRMIIPAVLFGGLGALLWQLTSATTGAIFAGIGVVWVLLELALGPTAMSRIRTTGASVDLPLVARTRRARKVLAKIDAAIRATRVGLEQPAESTNVSAELIQSPVQANTAQMNPEPASDTASLEDATQTNE